MMKLIQLFYIICFIGLYEIGYAQTFDYQRGWATYFGDEGVNLSDNTIDSEGNIYLVGSVKAGSVFSATTNAHQVSFGGGSSDGFLTKLNPAGEILWSTFIGGESGDAILGITIGVDNSIYLLGRTGSANGIATSNAWQTNIEGSSDEFLAKFNTYGTRIWSTYYTGSNSDPDALVTSITHSYGIVANKSNDGIYFYTKTNKTNAATPNAFQTTINQTNNSLITKFSVDGQRIWATYYGINSSNIYSITLGLDGLYVAGVSRDCFPPTTNSYFSTPNSHQVESGSCQDIFVTKFSLAGERLWSTYYGNNYPEYLNKNSLLVVNNVLYFTGNSIGSNNITTPNSYQEQSENTIWTPFLAKFDILGNRIWASYIGLEPDNFDDVDDTTVTSFLAKDSAGNVFVSGTSRLQENIATIGAYQETKLGRYDSFVAQFNADGDVNWGTYYGSNENDYASKSLVYNDVFYLVGETVSETGITTPNSIQPDFIDGGNNTDGFIRNVFIVRFEPLPLSVEAFAASNFEVYPNPNQGSFNIKNPNNEPYTVQIYNMLGQLVLETGKKQNSVERIDTLNLSSGSYLLSITTDSNATYTQKMLITN
ncbi:MULTISPECIES: T9SS type A sorting domain-containing protein [Bizionia]|uniref:T9SS type A sorting domain-containing protein n=1 Tax=Bizionia algoritergicola TaxID=291187 RepID=A0A5D0QZX3_9FLAO|nr:MULTISPECIES: T9SS type A sorting domain-containing protein [Bizionia]OBX21820.1 hypothetical protein BAA08_11250 [Bizionia sp. APA-3]TYB74833.1 T9SS type A sorting domain-containing protein [Bizionia algoritergicola]